MVGSGGDIDLHDLPLQCVVATLLHDGKEGLDHPLPRGGVRAQVPGKYVKIFKIRFKYCLFSEIYGVLCSSRTLLAISNFKNIFFSSRTFPELEERVATLNMSTVHWNHSNFNQTNELKHSMEFKQPIKTIFHWKHSTKQYKFKHFTHIRSFSKLKKFDTIS